MRRSESDSCLKKVDEEIFYMVGRSPEFRVQLPEATDAGFSEKRASRILEGKQTDNSQIKKRNPLLRQRAVKRISRIHLSLKEKILAAYKKNEKAIHELVNTVSLMANGSPEDLMVQIQAKQKIQEELLQALILEGRGVLQEDTLSKELQDLIK